MPRRPEPHRRDRQGCWCVNIGKTVRALVEAHPSWAGGERDAGAPPHREYQDRRWHPGLAAVDPGDRRR